MGWCVLYTALWKCGQWNVCHFIAERTKVERSSCEALWGVNHFELQYALGRCSLRLLAFCLKADGMHTRNSQQLYPLVFEILKTYKMWPWTSLLVVLPVHKRAVSLWPFRWWCSPKTKCLLLSHSLWVLCLWFLVPCTEGYLGRVQTQSHFKREHLMTVLISLHK